MELAIMVEGQNGLNWPRWQRIAHATEELGFAGLFRSDHFTNGSPPDLDSLELWTSLTWLASHTSRIQFGPLVSPVSFRHPSLTARMAAAVDDLSGGRLILGLGAGWQEREHRAFGFDLLNLPQRFARFEEALVVITSLLCRDQPVSFQGTYYRLQEAILLPRPARPGGPPILIGGNGARLTLPLVARYANEWNCFYLPANQVAILNAKLNELLVATGRSPAQVRRSMMTGCIYGRTSKEVEEKVRQRTGGNRTPVDLRKRGALVGMPQEITGQLNRLKKAGIQRVMLQWLDLDDIAGLEALAKDVLPTVK